MCMKLVFATLLTICMSSLGMAENGLGTYYQIDTDMQLCIEDSSKLEDRIMLECIFRAHRRYERVVDTCYSWLLEEYPTSRSRTLQANQEAWKAYIETQIQMNREHYETYSARMYRVIEARERVRLWKHRALYLSEIYKTHKDNLSRD